VDVGTGLPKILLGHPELGSLHLDAETNPHWEL
jgi:hypothetical protein